MKTRRYKKRKTRKAKKSRKILGGYNQPSDIDSVRLLLRSSIGTAGNIKLPQGEIADLIARAGISRLPPNLANQLQTRATDLQNRYQRYADQLQFNRDHLERARARYPHAFLPGALPFPIRQTGYTWHPRGEIDNTTGRPLYAGEDRFAREF